VPGSTGDWKAHGARFGKVPSKSQTIFGYKLHLLVTLGGVILDFELAPANLTDLTVGFELLSQHTDLDVLGDKAYISATHAAKLWQGDRLRLQTLPRRNQKLTVAPEVKRLFNAARQIIETWQGFTAVSAGSRVYPVHSHEIASSQVQQQSSTSTLALASGVAMTMCLFGKLGDALALRFRAGKRDRRGLLGSLPTTTPFTWRVLPPAAVRGWMTGVEPQLTKNARVFAQLGDTVTSGSMEWAKTIDGLAEIPDWASVYKH
jgi:hypothetical protein